MNFLLAAPSPAPASMRPTKRPAIPMIPFAARKVVGESRRPSPAARSLALIPSSVAFGLTRSTTRAIAVAAGPTARSRIPAWATIWLTLFFLVP